MAEQRPGPHPFTGRLPLGARPALLMIDMVRAYFEPGAPFFLGSDAALTSASRVLAAAREKGIPIIHTRVEYTPGGIDGGVFYRKVPQLSCFDEGGRLGEIMPDVAPLETEPVIAKQYASAFFGTSLSSTLRVQGIDTVVIAGVSTSGCVRATAVDAMQHGYIPVVVRDAAGDRSPGPHESNLFDIQAKYGEVVDEAEILDYLAGLGGPHSDEAGRSS